MKVLHICYSDLEGGAARAAFRLHKAQRKQGIDSQMLVVNKVSDDPNVHTVSNYRSVRIKLASLFSRLILRFQKSSNSVHHSLNFFPSGLKSEIQRISPDIVHLHWIGGEMLSIGEVGSIKQPVFWTLHDMWAFSGTEHYDDDDGSERYQFDYNKKSRNSSHKGVDLDRWIYLYKKKSWSGKTFHIITPSNWLAECVHRSSLFSGMPTSVISNCIDHDVYRPMSREVAREALGLPQEKILLLFGAMSSTADRRKGYHLLMPALQQLAKEGKTDSVELIVFGASLGDDEQVTGIKAHYMGRLHDDISLSLLYNAANLFVAPSLQDNLPNTLVESLACGTPCIAFDIGGMKDLISTEDVGILVENVSAEHLNKSLSLIEDSHFDKKTISNSSRNIRDESIISRKYLEKYNQCINGE